MKIFVGENILIKDKIWACGFKPPYSATVVNKIIAAGMQIVNERSGADASLELGGMWDGFYYIRPTYGTVSRFGVIANVSSADQVGVWAKNLDDGCKILSVIAGHDKNDGTSYSIEKYEYFPSAEKLKTVKFNELNFKYADYLAEVYQIISSAEFSANMSRFDGLKYGYRTENFKNMNELVINSRSESFAIETKLKTLMGAYVLSEGQFEKYYLKATKIRRLIKQELDEMFKQVDVIRVPDTVLAYLTGCPALIKPDYQCFITRNGQEGNFYGI